MKLTAASLALVFSILLLPPHFGARGEANIAAPHGFDFGISRKEALARTGELGLEVASDSKYSKKLRKVVLRASAAGGPAPGPGRSTLLEFYEDRLMSSSLLLSFENGEGFASEKNRLEADVRGDLGESFKRDRVFSYEVTRWDLPDILVLMSVNSDKKTIKLEYVSKSVLGKKTAADLELKRRNPPGDPAKEMFVDGDYSTRPRR